MLLNVKEMGLEDIQHVLESVLLEFPVREVRFTVPAWLHALEPGHWLVSHVMERIRSVGDEPRRMRESDVFQEAFAASDYVPDSGRRGSCPAKDVFIFP